MEQAEQRQSAHKDNRMIALPGQLDPLKDACPHCGGGVFIDPPWGVVQPKQIMIDADGAAQVLFQPSTVNEPFAQHANLLLQTIASNLGIPADVLTDRGTSSLSGAQETFSQFQQYVEAERKMLAQMAEVFQPVIAALRTFASRLEEVALCAYLLEFGKLPGSHRTSRLRKKRRTKVMKWFTEVYLPAEDAKPMGFQGSLSLVEVR